MNPPLDEDGRQMNTWLTRTIETHGVTLEWLGSCRGSPGLAHFLRAGARDLVLLIRPRSPDQPSFVQSAELAVTYRCHPSGPIPEDLAQGLRSVAERLLRRTDPASLQAPLPAVPDGLLRIRLSDEGGFGPRVTLELTGGPVPLRFADQPTLPLVLFARSASVDVADRPLRHEERVQVQRFLLMVAAQRLFAGDWPGVKRVPELTDTRDAVVVAADLAVSALTERALQALQTAGDREIRLQLSVPSVCRQFCIFCPPYPRQPQAVPATATILQNALDLLAEVQKRRRPAQPVSVLLYGHDVLESDALFALLQRIDETLHPHQVTLVTPGSRLQQRAMVDRLAAAGVDSVVLTLLGPGPDVHDLVAGRPGAFDDLMQALSHLHAAGLQVSLNTVVVQQNVAVLPDTLRLAATLGVRVRLYGYTSEPFTPLAQARAVAPRLSELAALMERCRPVCESLLQAIQHVPPCVLPDWARPLARQIVQTFPDPPDDLPAACQACAAYGHFCSSVTARYLAVHGAAELRPL